MAMASEPTQQVPGRGLASGADNMLNATTLLCLATMRCELSCDMRILNNAVRYLANPSEYSVLGSEDSVEAMEAKRAMEAERTSRTTRLVRLPWDK